MNQTKDVDPAPVESIVIRDLPITMPTLRLAVLRVPIPLTAEEREHLLSVIQGFDLTRRGFDLTRRSCDDGDTIEDGFGSAWSKTCPECERQSMEVVRPGKVQCMYCG